MSGEGPTTVGSIKGDVQIDIAAALAKIEEVKAAVASLGNQKPIKVSVDTSETAKAKSAIKDVGKAGEDAAKGVEKVGKAAGTAGKEAETAGKKMAAAFKPAGEAFAQVGQKAMPALIGGLVAISTAIPPVAAMAAGLGVSMVGMGAAGMLGLAGITRGLKEGSAVGVAYSGTVSTLKDNLHSLQDSAAMGLLPGVQAGVDRLQSSMPALSGMMQHFGGMLGSLAAPGLDAIITMLERGMPLFDAAGQYVQGLVTSLDGFSHSNGFGDFISYALANLPNVEQLLGTAIKFVGDFLAAWAPVGSVTLPIVTGLLTALDGIVTHTGPLVPLIVGVVGAFTLWSAIAPIVEGVTLAIGAISAAMDGMAISEAIATGGLSLLLGVAAAGGAIALLSSVGQAPTGTAPTGMPSTFGAPSGPTVGAYGLTTPAPKPYTLPTAAPAPKATTPSGNLGGGDTSYNGYGAGATAAASAASAGVPAHKAAASAVNAEAVAAQNAATKYNTLATAENTAATNAQSLEGSTDSAKDTIAGLSDQVKKNGTSLDQNTAKGRANREAMVAAAQGWMAAGTAVTKSTGSAAAGQVAQDKLGQAYVNAAVKAGMGRKAAESLGEKLLGLPKGVTIAMALKAAGIEAKAEQQAAYVQAIAKRKYQMILDGDFTPAQKAAARAKLAAEDMAKGDYKAILRGDFTPAQKAAATAAEKAKKFATDQYKAFLKADPSAANASSTDAARKAHAFAAGAYRATLTANASQAIGTAQATVAQINAMRASIQVSVTAVGGNGAQVARNALLGPWAGGTAGTPGFGRHSVPGMAYGGTGGGTISGPGHASSDLAGVYRLANGEEVVSNVFGQADKWRPLLKAISAGKLDSATFAQIASRMGPRQVAGHKTVIAPEIHIHNPVAVDPVQQASEAAQYALAYAGLG